jgi:hypothetical protein
MLLAISLPLIELSVVVCGASSEALLLSTLLQPKSGATFAALTFFAFAPIMGTLAVGPILVIEDAAAESAACRSRLISTTSAIDSVSSFRKAKQQLTRCSAGTSKASTYKTKVNTNNYCMVLNRLKPRSELGEYMCRASDALKIQG